MNLVPVTLAEANAFVEAHHRHHGPVVGHLFSLGATKDGSEINGVCIVGRPVARLNQDGYTAEVTRLCTDDACSFLYARAWRAAQALGYRRMITYTLPEEGGASLRAADWKLIGPAGGGGWNRTGRPRVDTHPLQEKLRWEATLPAA